MDSVERGFLEIVEREARNKRYRANGLLEAARRDLRVMGGQRRGGWHPKNLGHAHPGGREKR